MTAEQMRRLQMLAVSGTANLQTIDLLPGLENREPAEQILLAAAIHQAEQLAGYVIPYTGAPMPETAPDDPREHCTPEAVQYLMLLAKGHYANVLPEYIAGMREAERQILPEYLPVLMFDRDLDREQQRNILDLARKRGRWLIQQKSGEAWGWVRHLFAEWDAPLSTGEKRAIDRDAARAALETRWYNEDHVSVQALQGFSVGLSMADEPFLSDVLLQTTDMYIRYEVAELLAQLPESRFMQQLTALMADLVDFDAESETLTLKKLRPDVLMRYPLLFALLQIDIPGVGIVEKHIEQVRERLFSYQHPATLLKKWNISLVELLWFASEFVETNMLIVGWARAIHRQQDVHSAEIFLRTMSEALYNEEHILLLTTVLQTGHLSGEDVYHIAQQSSETRLFLQAWARVCYSTRDPQICYEYLSLSLTLDITTMDSMSKHLTKPMCERLMLDIMDRGRKIDTSLFLNLIKGCGYDLSHDVALRLIAVWRDYFHDRLANRQPPRPVTRFTGHTGIIQGQLGDIILQAVYRFPLDLEDAFMTMLASQGEILSEDSAVTDYRGVFRFRRGMQAAITGEQA